MMPAKARAQASSHRRVSADVVERLPRQAHNLETPFESDIGHYTALELSSMVYPLQERACHPISATQETTGHTG